MFRHLYFRPRPSLLRSAVGCRQFGSRPNFNFSNYAPPPPGPYFYTPPRSKASRLIDMAIGSVLTIGAYISYTYREVVKDIEEVENKINELRAEVAEWHQSLTEARLAGDRDRLRELSLNASRPADEDWIEVGPLPGLPEGETLHGKEAIPEEDTLMFIRAESVEIFEPSLLVNIALNADCDDILPVNPDNAEHSEGVLSEILLRLNYQAAKWVQEGILAVGGNLCVTLCVREYYPPCYSHRAH
ncbi:hypothetical protein F5Y13DRAFT_22488 [Hypoxylon sp. FL1857]|nr:hypothetical protein F5Y13DRAFT_22488 [Hypoxylon sp. FL1857]